MTILGGCDGSGVAEISKVLIQLVNHCDALPDRAGVAQSSITCKQFPDDGPAVLEIKLGDSGTWADTSSRIAAGEWVAM